MATTHRAGWLHRTQPPARRPAQPGLGSGRRADARRALGTLPEPPADLLYEALCCLQAAVALELGDRAAWEQAHARLRPAAGQLAGAGSGLLTLGPVDKWLSLAVSDEAAPKSDVQRPARPGAARLPQVPGSGQR
ncbi:hypothetical protein ACFYRY_41840 [Streptomyces sp. NPDC005263]|uniref:hypothetical protein n=1 Tax=Streptomyces sp. NPDC005263 TaxID=3364711 RepID=UPI00367C3160